MTALNMQLPPRALYKTKRGYVVKDPATRNPAVDEEVTEKEASGILRADEKYEIEGNNPLWGAADENGVAPVLARSAWALTGEEIERINALLPAPE